MTAPTIDICCIVWPGGMACGRPSKAVHEGQHYCGIHNPARMINRAPRRKKASAPKQDAVPSIPLPAAPVQGWISVKDRLPDDDCAVLVASWRYITGEQKVSSAHYSYGLKSFTEHSVTHWQPLPPPPAGDSND